MERRKVKAKAAGNSAAFSGFSVRRHRLYRYLIHFIYPNRCSGCNKIIGFNDPFCESCAKKLIPCKKDFTVENTDAFTAFCMYDGIARKILLNFKSDPCGNTDHAFAYGIFRALSEKELCGGIELITYIPMERGDFEKRGYNQTELIARELRFLLKVPCAGVLEKCHKTEHQKSLGGEERRRNMIGAFRVTDPNTVRGRRVLLVDDLCTTGSTISAAAKALREAGASEVVAAAFAKTAYDSERSSASVT